MNTIVTIGRQFGSGGRYIGRQLAERCGIPFYDRELLSRVAKESGFCEEFLDKEDERPTSSFLYNLVMDTYAFGHNAIGGDTMPISQKVFLAQFNTIKKVADEGPCVIIGRCADCALEDRDNVINLFIHASEEYRLHRLHTIGGYKNGELPEEEGKIRDYMQQKDRQRQSYYNYYSMKKWGQAESYDLCINSELLGTDGTVDMILEVIRQFEANKKKA